MRKRFFVWLSLTIIAQGLFSQIVINEISICNVSKQLDPSYDYSGWIELYNSSSEDLDLKDFCFSDEEDRVRKYTLKTSRKLPAHGYAVVWINDEVNDGKGGNLDVDAEGGYLSVSTKEGEVLDVLYYPDQFTNVSYGRSRDGDKEAPVGHFLESTFCASNNQSVISYERVEAPEFSMKSGFYNALISVSICCATAGAKVYYTMDGTVPTEEFGRLYTNSPLLISKTTPLRAKAFAPNFLEGSISTATYMIDERESDLPVVFLTMDSVFLYNDSIGIYCIGTNGAVKASNEKANWNQEWTRFGNMEFLDKQHELKLNQEVGLAISGNASREYPQKSFTVKAGKKYGTNRLDYPFFLDRPGRRFKSIILRNGGQYSSGGAIIRDAAIQSMADVTPLTYQAYSPAAIYLNGEYWGILNLRERSSKDNLYSNYGYGKDEFDLIERAWDEIPVVGNLEEYKKMESFIRTADLSADSLYNQAVQMIDIDNYLYYMSVELFIGNTDWPRNNQKFFRPKEEDAKWRWLLNDLDKGMRSSSVKDNKLREMKESSSTTFAEKMIFYLLKNKHFENQYITTQCIVAGSVYNPERFTKQTALMKERIASEYPYYQQRWPEQAKDLDKGVKDINKAVYIAWQQAYYNLQENFDLGIPHGLFITSSQPSVSLGFNQQFIPVLPYDGKYFQDRELALTAPLYESEECFKHWEITTNGRTFYYDSPSIELVLTDSTTVRAVYEPVEKSRRAGLYINEISAENSIFADNTFKIEDWIEIYNSAYYDIDMKDYYLSNNPADYELFHFSSDSNGETIIPAHGRAIVWCSKKPERGVLHANFKLAKEGGSVYLSKRGKDGNLLLVDSIRYAMHSGTTSYGRYPDGAEYLVFFDNPTFNKANQYSTYNISDYTEEYVLLTDLDNDTQATPFASVYTNSSHTQLCIESEKEVQARIYTMDGQLIYQSATLYGHNMIEISSLPEGSYTLVLEKNGEYLQIKFLR